MNSGRFISNLLLLLFLASQVTLAQVTTGTISGTVRDTTGAVVPGAEVVIRNMDTGLTRQTTSDAAGRYHVSQLSLGAYEVEVSLSGFQTAVQRGITMTVGREAVVNMSLSVGAVTERIEVTAEAPLVETTNASVGYLVGEKTIQDLPLNGRNYTALATLQPGVSAAGNLDRQNNNTGKGSMLSVSGSQSMQNGFLMDGQDLMGPSGRTPGSAAGTNLGVDAIREFSVLSNNYSAEYGTVSGGVVNVVTRSGTNQLHGSVFEYLRNAKLDAKNYFDKAADPIPPFKRNQFGGAAGGPILRDRTFFMGAYEGLRQRLGLTLLSPVPNARAHAGFLPDAKCPTGCGPGAQPGEIFLGVHPVNRPRLAPIPLPNGQDFGDGTGNLTSSPSIPTREDYALGRIDHQLSAADSIFGRYVMDWSAADNQFEKIPIIRSRGVSHIQYFTLNWVRMVSPRVINEARAGVNRSFNDSQGVNLTGVPEPQWSIYKGGTLASGWAISSPQINNTATGFSNTPNSFGWRIWEFADNVSFSSSRHAVKTGVILKKYRANTMSAPRGTIGFQTLRDFLLGQPRSLGGSQGENGASWGNSLFGWFVQDDIQLTRNLTLNVGLRHEFTTPPNEKYGRSAFLNHWQTDTLSDLKVGQPPYETPKDNFAPRLGLAWDVFGNGRTALRAGGGVYHEQMVATTFRLSGGSLNYPFRTRVSFFEPNFLTIDPAAPVPAGALAVLARESESVSPVPARYHWSLNIQQQIASSTTVSAGYTGARSIHMGGNWSADGCVNNFRHTILPDGRKFWQAPFVRINPAFNSTTCTTWDGDGYYHSLQLSLVRRFSNGLQYQVAYTWSRNIDNGVAGEGHTLENGGSNQDYTNRAADKALSTNDVRHLFRVNATYDLPFGANLPGVAKSIIHGWQVNGMLSLNTGLAFNISNGISQSLSGRGDRPDLKPGASNSPVTGTTSGCPGVPAGQKLGTPTLYFDPCAFELQQRGTYGNLGRNTVIGPGLYNFDLSLTKRFDFNERSNLQFRAEFF
ncbi:MAG: TonB-dependent receptor, partial [Acidobacteria bacterium]|nr:TonB-dependent receptor [Acidobacteriota bacterium]